MGVGGSFWDLLKPYARHEGAGYLRGRRVAVDLSFWVVSHSAAIRARSPHARLPHLRTLFFRTLSLFSKVSHPLPSPQGFLPSPPPRDMYVASLPFLDLPQGFLFLVHF
jgi:hypothetical protein